MNTIKIQVIAFALCLFSSIALAEESKLEQKLIFLNGTESTFMRGDKYFISHAKPLNYDPHGVLPFLLENGWRVTSVHVNDKSTEDNLYGYVVIEKVN